MTGPELEAFLTAAGNAYTTAAVDGGTAFRFHDRGCAFTVYAYTDDPSFVQIEAQFAMPPGTDPARLAAIAAEVEHTYRLVKLQAVSGPSGPAVVVSAEQLEPDGPGFADVFWRTLDTIRKTRDVLEARVAAPPPPAPFDAAADMAMVERALVAGSPSAPPVAPTAEDRLRLSLALLRHENGNTGTAFCIAVAGEQALFVTNAHVVEDAATVTLYLQYPAYRKLTGSVVVKGASNTVDLAFVAVAANDIRPADLAPEPPKPDVPVALAGYPMVQFWAAQELGELVPSIHLGTVTHVTRSGAIMHDAPTHPGNSGGPLFDPASGVVYGVAKAAWDGEQEAIAICVTVVAAFLAEHQNAVVSAS